MQQEEAQGLQELVRQARATRRLVEGGRSRLALAEAYRIQEQLGSGRLLRGYKLGLVSPAKQAQMGINAPIYGRIYADMLLEPTVRLSRFLQPRFEPEIVVALAGDLVAGASLEKAQQAVGAVYLGLDVLDSVWAGYRFTPAEVVADNASGGGFVLGSEALALPLEGTLRLFFDETLIGEGMLAAPGTLEQQLLWLAGQVGVLRGGQLIYLGSPLAAQEARPGLVSVQGPRNSRLSAIFVQ
jgi:2-keto-4-pentenoate hydratase